VILRFELEQELINGNLSVSQLPQAWNQKMEDYLGIVPDTYRDGCLQDIHWTMVGFGYFPTYTLGNFYAAQFLEAAQDQVVEIKEQLSQGDLTNLAIWLRENIHQYGRKLRPAEIVFRATGKPLDQEAFIRYAFTKFGELYNLN
jgi:carboxypeptidase Taq